MKIARPLIAAVLLVSAGSALAHPGHDTGSFFAGFSHPLSGADHLLAMLAVGLYAGTQKGAARWALPCAFVASMILGALLAQTGVVFPAVEAGIAASVLVLGLLIAFAARLPLALTAPVIGLLALCHGAAHYAEKGGAGLATFAAGFVLATALLHGAGYLLARWTPQTGLARTLQRVLGGLIAGTGLVMLGS
ncbi:HupE/UreJ family protein [Niveibacterium sp. SC-1]|uniref:HupE/UreJ family protein n=1 Tax=Niveibacterium sp. SC-1 TaxID=3135646 RepID=UPI00311E0C0B